MNNTDRENGTMAGPLIFTVPLSGKAASPDRVIVDVHRIGESTGMQRFFRLVALIAFLAAATSGVAGDDWLHCRVIDSERLPGKKIVYTLKVERVFRMIGTKKALYPDPKIIRFEFHQTLESDPLFVGQEVEQFGEDIWFRADPIRWRKVGSHIQFIMCTTEEKKFISLVPNSCSMHGSVNLGVTVTSDSIDLDDATGPAPIEIETFVPDSRFLDLELANKSGNKVTNVTPSAGWRRTKNEAIEQ